MKNFYSLFFLAIFTLSIQAMDSSSKDDDIKDLIHKCFLYACSLEIDGSREQTSKPSDWPFYWALYTKKDTKKMLVVLDCLTRKQEAYPLSSQEKEKLENKLITSLQLNREKGTISMQLAAHKH
ncbi:MAG: hypothetical protein AB7R69_00060 [Candidatus Babeliales bacterium]